MFTRTTKAGLGGLILATSVAVAGATTMTADANVPAVGGSGVTLSHAAQKAPKAKVLHARLNTLNNSGAYGNATVTVKGKKVTVRIRTVGMVKNAPHAGHFHFTPAGRHRCPTNAQDTNGDGHVNVAEGTPVYGDIVASLTTKGDTSPSSALAIDRFPTTPKGVEKYKRTFMVTARLARVIKKGEVVIVLHGVDYNNNGTYDLGDRGPSEIAPSLPAEATDPAVCGVVK